ncbi:oocyte zinc finger protein XlCOF6-like [Engraulis encrasicolus]|uniref:oocyte zinc finger protein XlCOF6-like n=1 Tax=Engraulis encrasicolus TaxID=184585 RepID=UPI002FD164F5
MAYGRFYVIRALRDEVQTLQQQLEQHRWKYRDDNAIGQRRQQGRRARGNDITTSGCEIPPNIFLSCTSGDDPTDTPTSPQELEDDSADFPASPTYDDDDDDALTSPWQLKLPLLSVKLQDCRAMLGPNGVYIIQSIEDISDDDYNNGYNGYPDDDSDFNPSDSCFEEPVSAGEEYEPSRGVKKVKKSMAPKRHYEKRYACTECGETFSFPSRLARHQRAHAKKIDKARRKEEKARLKEEKKKCATATTAAGENPSTESTHESLPKDANFKKRSFACDFCGKILAGRKCLQVHRRLHTGEMPYACKVCDKTFRQLGGLIAHRKQHLTSEQRSEKPVKKSAKEVIEEKKRKGVEHKCSLCSKEFPYPSYLIEHFKMVHSDDKPYICSQCPMRFSTHSCRKSHESTHSDERPFGCPLCGKAFKTKLSLKNHEMTHSELKPFACTFCNKAFRQKQLLKIHIRRHTGYKPFKCSLCDAAFVKNCELKDHLRRHTGEKPYLCAICGKTFSHPHILRTHQIVHTGEKPHQCTVCGERFSYLQPLYAHEKKVHNIVSHQCEECGKSFKSVKGLKKHSCSQGPNSTERNKEVEAEKGIEGVEAAKGIEEVEAARCIEEVEAARYIEEVEAARCIEEVEAAHNTEAGEAARYIEAVEVAQNTEAIEAARYIPDMEMYDVEMT